MMTRIVQWNCKGLRVRHEEVKLLINRSQPSCICLQEVMLENVKYNLGREYEFYAIFLQGQRSKGGTALAIKKEKVYKRLNIRTALQAVALELYMTGKGKMIICSIHLPPTDLMMGEDMRDLLEQLSARIILLGK